MNPILVAYATREGHAKRVAEHVAGEIRANNIPVTLLNLLNVPAGFCLSDYSAAVLAGSVHVGKHERELIEFVRHNRTELNRMLTAFVSISLSQAGVEDEKADPKDRTKSAEDVKRMLDAFLAGTGWHPTITRPLAGALLYSKYNFLVRRIMKRIARRAGAPTDTSRDYIFTNWRELDDVVTDLVARIMARPEYQMRVSNQGA